MIASIVLIAESNDVKRATFTPEEICDLTVEFYKRNYIEGSVFKFRNLKESDVYDGEDVRDIIAASNKIPF